MGKAQENTTMVCITVGRSGHLPSEVPGHAEDVRVLRPGQVFGLMDGRTDDECAGLLSAASRSARTSAMTGFVSNYRCGAAPELDSCRVRTGFPFNSIAISG